MRTGQLIDRHATPAPSVVANARKRGWQAQQTETIMMTKTMTVLATAAILAIASAAQADKDVTDPGGFHIGPLGQPMGAPHAWGATAPWSVYYNRAHSYGSYAYAPRGRVSRRWHYEP